MPPPFPAARARVRALTARDVSKAYGDRVVLDGIDLTAHPGVPLGLVGENGSGKSTLLRLLAGVGAADTGEVTRPSDVGYLPQHPAFPVGSTVADVLAATLAPLHDAAPRLERLAAALASAAGNPCEDEYGTLLDWCVLHDVWDADRRTQVAVARLGLDAVDTATPVHALSGGERSRLALAAHLARRPGCLLLDEPTNHLDDHALAFLEELVVTLPGVVVVASHDRTFLENTCGQIVDLDPSHFGTDGEGGNRFGGSYAEHLSGRRAARRRWEAAYARQQHELDLLRRVATTTARDVAHDRPPRDNDKFIHHAKGQNVARAVSRRVRDAQRRVEALEESRVPKPPRPLRLAVPAASALQPTRVASVRDLVVAGRLEVAHLDVDTTAPLLVTGANGSGKSTLLGVLAGAVAPTSGSAQVRARRVGLLPQDVTFARPERTARAVYLRLAGAAVPLTDLGLLHPRDVDRPVGVLSLGQQRRLALAVLLAQRPDLLLLDEPTNHISLTLAEELEEAVQCSPAAVVVATHDRWLRSRWTGPVRDLSHQR